MALEFAGTAVPLAPGDVEAEAASLRLTPAVVYAVKDVESAGAGFLPDGRPKILYEAHVFYTETHARFGISNVNLPSWNRSSYGAGGAHQYDRLAQAIKLDRRAALRSASWGMFQVMGRNCGMCGFSDVEAFVEAMEAGEKQQLDAFGRFIRINHLDEALRPLPPAFAEFARGYNGAGYAANGYDVKLAASWRAWRAKTAPGQPNPAPRTRPSSYYRTLQMHSHGDAVVALQRKLGVSPDADFGPVTLAAVVTFQQAHSLPADGVVGPLTRSAMGL